MTVDEMIAELQKISSAGQGSEKLLDRDGFEITQVHFIPETFRDSGAQDAS